MDWDGDAVSTPPNHLKIKRWDGNMEDQSLLDLGFMLRSKSPYCTNLMCLTSASCFDGCEVMACGVRGLLFFVIMMSCEI